MLSQEQSQVSGGVPALVGRLHDVLRVCWRRNVQVLDPLLSDDCRRTPVRSAPDELGQHCFFGDVHGVVYDRVEGEVGGPHWLSSPSIALDPRALRHRLAEGRPLPVRPAAR
jgi:hypothetical protein